MVSDSPPRPKFEFADGLRAVAAIAVALYHSLVYTGRSGDAATLPAPFKILNLGDFAVPIFIVLSGFVLMLPVARNADLRFRGGMAKFIQRRARRILPPYLAAFVLFLVLIWLTPILQQPADTAWDSKVPVTVGGVISHLLVVHNFSPEWIYQVDGPAWSVATEWQIYFAMPFLLLPLWRRFGAWVALAVAVTVGWAIHFTLPILDGAHFWFLGLFAMGMGAATIVVRGIRIPRLGVILTVVTPVLLAALALAYGPAEREAWISETVLGLVVAGVLVWLAQRSLDGRPSWAHHILESRFLVWVGLWSFSLYLIHSPLLALGNLLLLPMNLPTLVQFAVLVLVVLPLAAAIAYGFFILVERHFMTSHQHQVAKGEGSARVTKASQPQRRP